MTDNNDPKVFTGQWRNSLQEAQRDIREFIQNTPLGDRDSYRFEKRREGSDTLYRFAITKGQTID